jgi:hypothetical protein
MGWEMHLCHKSANMRPKVASVLATSPRSLLCEISPHNGTSLSRRVLSGRLHMGWRDPEDEPQAVGCHAGSTLHSTFPSHPGSSLLHACQGEIMSGAVVSVMSVVTTLSCQCQPVRHKVYQAIVCELNKYYQSQHAWQSSTFFFILLKK